MRAVVQRVSSASVSVDAEIVGKIGAGLMVLVGVEGEDNPKDAVYLADKVAGLRVFEDDQGLMNRDVAAVQGSVLAISQFTLLGDVRRGKRPSFITAAKPAEAESLFKAFCQRVVEKGLPVEQGVFQADMQVSLVNDGPVTILLDSRKLF